MRWGIGYNVVLGGMGEGIWGKGRLYQMHSHVNFRGVVLVTYCLVYFLLYSMFLSFLCAPYPNTNILYYT